MRPWRLRLTLRRSRVQWALLSVVMAVSLLSASLLATLYLLSDATETFAARTALTDASASDVRVVQRLTPTENPNDAITLGTEAADEFFGDVPFATTVHLQGAMIALPREDRRIGLSYFSAMDGVEDYANLVQGEWATAGGDLLEVTVPVGLLEDVGLEVGDELTLAPATQRSQQSQVLIVGSYQVNQPRTDFWRYDRLSGTMFNPNAPIPLSGGSLTTESYGPMVVDQGALTGSGFAIDDLNITHVPDFSQVSLEQTAELVTRFDDFESLTTRTIAADGRNVRVISSIDGTLGGVIGSLAVTRSSVLVTGLLLLVLSVAALGQTARMMAERRHSEQHLMIARGGSGRQILRLGFIEALALGALTAALAPVVARYAYQLITSQDAMTRAGMNQDPGLPWWTWAVTGIVGFILILVLVVPLMKRGGSFVDAEQSRSRPGKRAAFQRSGLDFALLVLAGLAYWQLQSYESPVITDGGVARLDPLLAAGPALALLAGSLIAVRLIPAASKFLESVASRGRRAVMPLAAWEVGRRSTRAVSAILLLTLAVSVGAFAMSFLTTWRMSQEHQAQFQHPADAVVSGLSGPVLGHERVVNSERLGATGSPALSTTGIITQETETSFQLADTIDGREVAVLAITEQALDFYRDGRLAGEGGDIIANALQGTSVDNDGGFELTAGAAGVQMDVTPSTSGTALEELTVELRGIVQDAAGRFLTVDLGIVPVDGEEHTVRQVFADYQTVTNLQEPVSLVGLQTVWSSTDEDASASELNQEPPLDVFLSVDGISSLVLREAALPVAGVDPLPLHTVVPVETEPSRTWYFTNDRMAVPSLERDGDQLRLQGRTRAFPLTSRAATVTLTAAPRVEQVPVMLTRNTLNQLGIDAGDPVLIQVGATVLEAYVEDSVGLLPSDSPRQEAFLVNYDQLALAVVQRGGLALEPSEWWVSVGDEDVAAYTASVEDDATVTSRVGLATSLQEDPLRVATQAALWLVTGAAVVLAAVGFAVHAVVTVRAREIEFAQLRAVGVHRRQLLRIVGGESLLLALLGSAFGVVIGVALGYLVAPLVSVGADGLAPIPSVWVDIPWTAVGLLVLVVATVLALTVALMSVMLRRINPAQMLRLGD